MNILVFGDSITQGYYDTENGGWCNRLHMHVMNLCVAEDWQRDFSVFNLGVSGDSLDQLHERFETEFRRRSGADCVTIFAYGINDSMSDASGNCRIELSSFEKLYAEYIELAKTKGHVVLIGLVPIDESQVDPMPWLKTHSYLKQNCDSYDEVVSRLAEERGCTFVPLNDIYKATTHTVDGVHPNSDGHELIFKRLKQVLEAQNIL